MGVPAVSSAIEIVMKLLYEQISSTGLILLGGKCDVEARVRRDLRAVWTHRILRVRSLRRV